VSLQSGGRDTIPVQLPTKDRYVIMPVFDRQIAPTGAVGARLALGNAQAGVQHQGGAGAQGVTSVPGYLDVGSQPTSHSVEAGANWLSMSYVGDGRPARMDGVLLQPELEWVVLGESGAPGQALLRSFSPTTRHKVVAVGSGLITAYAYDGEGRLVDTASGSQGQVNASVPPFGFTIVLAN
jgi:hypothetical protein